MSNAWEDAGWTREEFQSVLAEAESAFFSAASVRSLLPVGPTPKDRYSVTVPRLKVEDQALAATTESVRPLRLASKFIIRSEQLSDLEMVRRLTRQAAHKLAIFESQKLVFGSRIAGRDPVEVKGPDIDRPLGLASTLEIEGSNTLLDTMREAAAKLFEEAHGAPFGLLLPPRLMTEYSRERQSSSARRSLADLLGSDLQVRLVPLAKSDESTPDPKGPVTNVAESGILMSLGSGAADLVQVDPLSIAKVQEKDGDLVLRVEERIVLRLMEPKGIVRFRFSLKKSGGEQPGADPHVGQ